MDCFGRKQMHANIGQDPDSEFLNPIHTELRGQGSEFLNPIHTELRGEGDRERERQDKVLAGGCRLWRVKDQEGKRKGHKGECDCRNETRIEKNLELEGSRCFDYGKGSLRV